jgi:HAD superfamily hydrolase (TIGR01456 family)
VGHQSGSSPRNDWIPLLTPNSPYIFVTNGGGKTEEERCLDLSRQLEMEVSPGQFICGHTPMREMAQKYKTVLVVGGEGEKCRQVAEGYGFQDVVTPGDIIKDNKDTTPFRKLTQHETNDSRLRNFHEVEIDAVFVFADSRDWAGDQQIILDLLMSKNGRLGTRSETFDEGPPVFFSHNDVIWSTSHSLTRIGMGALRASLEAVFKAVTGKEVTTIAFGKPQLGTFQFATRLLQQWRKDTHGINSPPETVYFVGDTPESDIRGTNEFDESDQAGNSWYSILVRTGVYRNGTTVSPSTLVPHRHSSSSLPPTITTRLLTPPHSRASSPKSPSTTFSMLSGTACSVSRQRRLMQRSIASSAVLLLKLLRQIRSSCAMTSASAARAPC